MAIVWLVTSLSKLATVIFRATKQSDLRSTASQVVEKEP
jgi:hypothetical protein